MQPNTVVAAPTPVVKKVISFFHDPTQKMIHDRFLEVKDLIGNLCRGNADFLFETIDDNHNTFSGNTRNGQASNPEYFR